MTNISKYIFLLCLVSLSFLPSSFSQNPCNPLDSPTQKPFRACQNLPALGSTLYWNFYPSTGMVDIAFQQPVVSDSRWAAWAINPTSAGMVGSQAIIAFRKSDGTLSVYSSPIKSYGTQLEQGNLSFPLYDVSAVYENNHITIFATFPLPKNVTVVNHVWQEGPLSGNTPRMHSISGPNVKSFGTINFLSGKVEQTKGGSTASALSKLKITHAVLNTISWGILMPIGAIVARHLKVFSWADPAWFHAHRTCQMLAYIGGLSGWITGLWLGYKSSGVEYKGHRCIGISIFVLATLQVAAALFLRPKKTDQKRLYWNLFHYAVGYGTIGLSILNILKGFDIMQPGKQWKYAYIGTIVALGCLAVLFEPFRCYYVRRAKQQVAVEQESAVDAV